MRIYLESYIQIFIFGKVLLLYALAYMYTTKIKIQNNLYFYEVIVSADSKSAYLSELHTYQSFGGDKTLNLWL